MDLGTGCLCSTDVGAESSAAKFKRSGTTISTNSQLRIAFPSHLGKEGGERWLSTRERGLTEPCSKLRKNWKDISCTQDLLQSDLAETNLWHLFWLTNGQGFCRVCVCFCFYLLMPSPSKRGAAQPRSKKEHRAKLSLDIFCDAWPRTPSLPLGKAWARRSHVPVSSGAYDWLLRYWAGLAKKFDFTNHLLCSCQSLRLENRALTGKLKRKKPQGEIVSGILRYFPWRCKSCCSNWRPSLRLQQYDVWRNFEAAKSLPLPSRAG